MQAEASYRVHFLSLTLPANSLSEISTELMSCQSNHFVGVGSGKSNEVVVLVIPDLLA